MKSEYTWAVGYRTLGGKVRTWNVFNPDGSKLAEVTRLKQAKMLVYELNGLHRNNGIWFSQYNGVVGMYMVPTGLKRDLVEISA
jgi:hypothetical protein